jgi:O-antigen ligase
MILFAFIFPISRGGGNAVLGVILLLWIADANFKEKFNTIKNEKIVWMFLAIGILTLLSALFSTSMSHSFLAGEKKSLLRVIISHYIVVPFILIIFITSVKEKYLNYIISAFLASMFFSEIISYLIFFEIIDLSQFNIFYSQTSIKNPTPFLHHIEYSIFLSISIILLIHKIIYSHTKYLQFFLAIFVLSASINLFINGGRTGQITYLLGISIYAIYYFKFHIKNILLMIALLSIIIFTAYTNSSTFHNRSNLAIQNIQQIQYGNYNTSWGVRAASAQVVLSYLTSSPKNFIFGAGAGDSRQEYLTYAKKHFSKNIYEPIQSLGHLHNQYLEYWMDGTIFSLIFFIFIFYLLFTISISKTEKPLLLAILCIMLFAALTDNTFFRYQPFMLYLILIGYFLKKRLSNLKD